MFTGLIQATGSVIAIHPAAGERGARFHISAPSIIAGELNEGDSVACNGVCLTALNITLTDENGMFEADVSPETLRLTTFGAAGSGSAVNMELPLSASGRFGGHMVTGHVDGTCRLLSIEPTGEYQRYMFELPDSFAPYVARKGSICLDGVSLTVNDVATRCFSVMLIPHTLRSTTLGALAPGKDVNLEVDIAARYLLRYHEYTATSR